MRRILATLAVAGAPILQVEVKRKHLFDDMFLNIDHRVIKRPRVGERQLIALHCQKPVRHLAEIASDVQREHIISPITEDQVAVGAVSTVLDR